MKLLFWCDAFWPAVGGIPVIASSLARSLAERGHTLHVVADESPGLTVEWDPGVQVSVSRSPFLETLTSGSAARFASLTRSFAELKASLRPDLVLVYALTASVVFHLRTQRSWPSPSLLTLHGALPLRPCGSQTVVGRALRDADWVMAGSRSCLQEAIDRYPFVGEKSSVVRNAVEAHPQAVSRPSLGPLRLLYVGRLSAEKGVDVAISALRIVVRREPTATLQIAGTGPLRQDLEALAEQGGLADNVRFLGAVAPEAVRSLMAAASVVVVPSRNEGFSLVALEAAQAGRPVVATRVGGIPEVVTDGETGLLVRPEAPEALAAAILRLVDAPERAEAMGARARRRAEDEFRWSDYVEAYDARIRALGRR
jgi:glycosyltransferase involved in cell wall biosynthesis